MRFLKSLMILLFSIGIQKMQAQDTMVTTTGQDTAAFFHADKATGVTLWSERAIPDSAVQRLRNDEAFWYANADVGKKPVTDDPPDDNFLIRLLQQTWFYNLLWTLIICAAVAVMILFLARSNIWLFRKKPAAIAETNETAITENIFSINYNEELTKALAQGDFRLAIRLRYLQLLAALSGQKLITYKDGNTNSDYVMQLYNTPYYGDFKKLTRHFEYAWYGKFTILPEAYQTIETDFTAFKNSMGF